MKTTIRLLLPLTLTVVAAAAPPPEQPAEAPAADTAPGWDWYAALIPKAFQSNPRLEMSAFTEFTNYGRQLPVASPEHPVYFVVKNEGQHAMGQTLAGGAPPEASGLERTLYASLAARGFLPAKDVAHPPGLVLVFFWGEHYALDQDQAQMFPELAEQYMVERAALVGGRHLAHDISLEFGFGLTPLDHTPKKDFLRNQSAGDLYYVVVSAYRFADVAQDRRPLAWRTTLTVDARGVSMKESLPALIVTGADYFGRDMLEPVAVRRNLRRGTVTLGPIRFVGGDVPALPPPDQDRAR